MTIVIKTDRVTFTSLTADPATVAAGDIYYRSDLQRFKFAIDTVVANAKTLPVAPLATADIADSAITTAKIADSQITTAKIVDSAITSAKIADSAVTTAKTDFANQSLLTTSTVSFAQVNVGDLAFKYGWRISETSDELVIKYGDKPVLKISKSGRIIPCV